MDFFELSSTDIIFSLIWTWGVGVSIPLIIRYAILKKPLGKGLSITIALSQWFLMVFLSILMGSKSKTNIALTLVAFISYSILKAKSKKQWMLRQKIVELCLKACGTHRRYWNDAGDTKQRAWKALKINVNGQGYIIGLLSRNKEIYAL